VRSAIRALEWDRSVTPKDKQEETRAHNQESQAPVEAFRERLKP